MPFCFTIEQKIVNTILDKIKIFIDLKQGRLNGQHSNQIISPSFL